MIDASQSPLQPLPWTWHGGALQAARQAFPDAPQRWIDLSTGINPHGWPGAANIPLDWHRLPDPQDITALEAAAAAHYGVDPRHICAVPGTEMAMRLIADRLGGTGQYSRPAYRTHAEAFASSTPVDDLDDVDPDKPFIFANPVNPTGHVYSRAALIRLLDQRASGGWTLIDEAYADAVSGISMANHIHDDRKLLIFRSFGKFYGLPGVRLGFILGPAPFLAAFRAFIGAWPISTAAAALGLAAYQDGAWADQTRPRLLTSACRLDDLLTVHGLRPAGSCPLYRLINSENAAALFQKLAQHGILTRPFQDHQHWLRIGLPADTAAFARLAAALSDG